MKMCTLARRQTPLVRLTRAGVQEWARVGGPAGRGCICHHVRVMPALALAGLRIKESKEVYEGEVTEMTPEETESEAGGYGKVLPTPNMALQINLRFWVSAQIIVPDSDPFPWPLPRSSAWLKARGARGLRGGGGHGCR